MDTDYKVQVEHVSKAFKMYNTPMDKLKEAFSISGKVLHTEFFAVTDLSFQVKKGEILGIMGRNGSGKSTLLKMITGITEPTSGNIRVSGRISSLLELGTGFNMEYTGIENIFFYGTLMGFSRHQMEEKIQNIIDFAEIGDYIYQPVKTYSSGMFARLAFSCAVNVEPDILIVDEILSVGDMRFQAKCFNKFKDFKEKGVTILYVGHDVGMMRTFCDTAMWINKGRLVDIGDPAFISARYTEFMYLDDTADFTDYKILDTVSEKMGDMNENDVFVLSGEKNAEEPGKRAMKVENGLFPDSIAHWGSRTGMIKSVVICDASGLEKKHFSSEDTLAVNIYFDIEDDIDTEYFSVAFAVKNTEGTDIIVKTTYDEELKLKSGKLQKISFEFVSRLANGDYYLVIALEDRTNAAITYYEYIEGAVYFKIYSDKKIFGIFDPAAKINYKLCEEEKDERK